jgi:hypothetical protein
MPHQTKKATFFPCPGDQAPSRSLYLIYLMYLVTRRAYLEYKNQWSRYPPEGNGAYAPPGEKADVFSLPWDQNPRRAPLI